MLQLNKDPDLIEDSDSNNDSDNKDSKSPVKVIEIWKVLVLDQFSRRVVAPLLDTAQLKRLGITLTYDILQTRHPIYGVPAIYCVQPQPENITLICDVFLHYIIFFNIILIYLS